MPRYGEGISDEEFENVKQAIRRAGAEGPFDASDVLFALVQSRLESVAPGGILGNLGDVAAMLDDLTDIGYLERLDSDPPRWRTTADFV